MTEDYNEVFERMENEMIDAGATKHPKEARGGTFAPADIPVIKRALHTYLVDIQRIEGYSDRNPHPDLNTVANLLHRLGRIG